MRLNLSSQIVLNKVPVEFYRPKTTVEYSEISRMEKIHTDIFASMTEGASHVADKIEAGIKAAQQEGKFYVMALGAGSSLYSVYDELVRRYNEKTSWSCNQNNSMTGTCSINSRRSGIFQN